MERGYVSCLPGASTTKELIGHDFNITTDYGERNNPPLCFWHRVCDHRFLDQVPYRMGFMEGSMNVFILEGKDLYNVSEIWYSN